MSDEFESNEEYQLAEERQLAFERAIEPIEVRVGEAVEAAGMEPVVIYAAYDHGEDELPKDNLDEVAVEGFVVFRSGKTRFFGGRKSRTYWSPILFNPTWLEVAVLANAAILRTKNHSHCFFEGVREIVPSSGAVAEKLAQRFGWDTKFCKLCFGS